MTPAVPTYSRTVFLLSSVHEDAGYRWYYGGCSNGYRGKKNNNNKIELLENAIIMLSIGTRVRKLTSTGG